MSPPSERAPPAPAACLDVVDRLARARIGSTFNQYAHSPLRRERLRCYLERHGDAAIVLVGEAAGYRGARISGIPFTSERQLTGAGPAEATATIVHRTLRELGLLDGVLLWNVVPTHPGTESSNRRPTAAGGGPGGTAVPGGAHPGAHRDRRRPARSGGARRTLRPPPRARRRRGLRGRAPPSPARVSFRYNPASADAWSATFL